VLCALACLAAGCLEIKEHLTIRADGSGTLALEVHSAFTPEDARKHAHLGHSGEGRIVFPPLTKDHAMKLFPGDAFAVDATEGSGKDGRPTMLVKVTFKDVNALLAGPYGEAHALALWRDGEQLRFAARPGLLQAVLFSDSDKTEFFGRTKPRLFQALKSKNQMRAELTVTLPNAVDSSNGKVAKASATRRVLRSEAKDADALIKLCMEPLLATCPAAGIRFAPVTPPRLGLLPFDELKAGPAQGVPTPPDPAKVVAAARFVPHMLKTAHSFYLPGREPAPEERKKSGERLHEAAADLVGTIELPKALAPDHWGQVQIDEVADDAGMDLKFGQEERRHLRRTRSGWDRTVEREASRATDAAVRHPLWLRFRPPGPKAKRIARLRGSVELEYFDDYQVVKLPNAIPQDWVGRRDKDGRRVGGGGGPKKLDPPLLRQWGIEISVLRAEQEAMRPSRRERRKTTFWFHVNAAAGARVLAFEVFDARGMAWPKIPWHLDMLGRVDSDHFAVPGAPEPPFSLALLVSARSVKARVPIRLQNLPLGGKAE
jgi:hypothetical protein